MKALAMSSEIQGLVPGSVQPRPQAAQSSSPTKPDALFPKESIDYLGFKKIRYFQFINRQSDLARHDKLLTGYSINGELKLEGLLLFLHETFKRSHFILLKRKPEEICKSAWWKNTDKFNHNILQEDMERFYLVSEIILRKNNFAYSVVDFKSLVDKNHEKLGRIFKELGINYDYSLSGKALNHNHDHCE